MYRDPRSDMPVTQFNMKMVEEAGLVKFDFLGLKTLTVLQTAVKLLKRRGIDVDLSNCRSTTNTYEMLSRGETVGVFQVESAGMRKALIGMRPDRIEDIIALVALYRPGPMENIPTYNARKNKEEEIASIHPKIDHLVKETQGVIIYQEQVMQIAQEMSGYTLGEADLLRRAMGKKIRAEMDMQRVRFVDGAVERADQAASQLHLRSAGQVRRLRLQQIPCRRLCDRVIPDGLHEGPLSSRIPCRINDIRHVAIRTSSTISAGRRYGLASKSSRLRSIRLIACSR